jgi:hypothetical protein
MEFASQQGRKIILYPKASTSALDPSQTPIWYVPGAVIPHVRLAGRELEISPLSSEQVKNEWRYTFASPCVFVVYTDNFALTFMIDK